MVKNQKGFSALIIVAIIALVLAAGAGAYFLFMGDDKETTEHTHSEGEDHSQEDSGTPSSFAGLEPPYVMTVTSEDSVNDELSGTFVYKIQDEDTWELTSTTSAGESRIVYAGEYTYIQGPDKKFIRYPAGSGQQDASFDQYQLDETQLNQLGTVGKKSGTADCPGGTCDVYELDLGGTIYKYFVTSGGQIVRMEYKLGTAQYSVEFTKEDVNIEVPTDFQEIPSAEDYQSIKGTFTKNV